MRQVIPPVDSQTFSLNLLPALRNEMSKQSPAELANQARGSVLN